MTREDAATTTAARRTATPDELDIAKLSVGLAALSTASSENGNASKQYPDPTQEDNHEHPNRQALDEKHQQQHQQQHQHQQHQQHQHHPYEGQQDGGLDEPKEEGQEEPKEDCILFIGDLARGLSEADLAQAFACVGKVEMVDIKRDKLTMRNLGYGFVQMSTREEAAAAKERMQDVEIQGRRIRVGWAQRNTALFIGDLDESTTIDDLHRAFGLFGPLYEDQTYLRQGKYGKYGSCKFQSRHDAEAARREMHGRILGAGAYPIRVVWHHPQTSSTGSGGPSASNFHHHHHSHGLQHVPPPPPPGVALSSRPYSVHVQFEADAVNTVVTEGLLHSFFAPFGEVIAVILPQGPGILSSEGEGMGGSYRRGYGFVHFSGSALGRQCAIEAIRTLQGEILDGIRLQCAFSKKPGGPVRPGTGPGPGPVVGGSRVRAMRGSPVPPSLMMMQPHAPAFHPPHPHHYPHPHAGRPVSEMYRPAMGPGSPMGGGNFGVAGRTDNFIPCRDGGGGDEYMQQQEHQQHQQHHLQHPMPRELSQQQPYSPPYTGPPPSHGGPYADPSYNAYPPYPVQPQEAYFHGQPPHHQPPYEMHHPSHCYSPPFYPAHPARLVPPLAHGLDEGNMGPAAAGPYLQRMGSSDSSMGGPGSDHGYHEGQGHGHAGHFPQEAGLDYPPPPRAFYGGGGP